MQPLDDQPISLSIPPTFVVQIQAEIPIASGLLSGRAEHIVSGQDAHFVSTEALLAF